MEQKLKHLIQEQELKLACNCITIISQMNTIKKSQKENGRPKYRFEQCCGATCYQRNRPNTDMCSYILLPPFQNLRKVVDPQLFAQGTIKEHFLPLSNWTSIYCQDMKGLSNYKI
jgi:hypothetical protein